MSLLSLTQRDTTAPDPRFWDQKREPRTENRWKKKKKKKKIGVTRAFAVEFWKTLY